MKEKYAKKTNVPLESLWLKKFFGLKKDCWGVCGDRGFETIHTNQRFMAVLFRSMRKGATTTESEVAH